MLMRTEMGVLRCIADRLFSCCSRSDAYSGVSRIVTLFERTDKSMFIHKHGYVALGNDRNLFFYVKKTKTLYYKDYLCIQEYMNKSSRKVGYNVV